MNPSPSAALPRRQFLAGTFGAAGCAAAAVAPGAGMAAVRDGGADGLRVGLVGCGGRGTGAAMQAANAAPGVRIVAIGDVCVQQLVSSARLLSAQLGGRFDCPQRRRFVGADAIAGVLASGVDLVILAAPPHVLAGHLAAAVRAGVHAYCEAPVAIDVAGVHEAAAAIAVARVTGISIGAGLCYRHDEATCDRIDAIHGGVFGRIEAARVEARIGLPWRRAQVGAGDAAAARLANWVSYAALSGGPFVEHHVHAIDKALWALGDAMPVSAEGRWIAGRRDAGAIGDCHDGTTVRYTLADGRTIDAICHRRPGLSDQIEESVVGTGGRASLLLPRALNRPNRFESSMNHLVRGVCAGQRVDEGGRLCSSTLVAVMGRIAAESNRRVAWDDLSAPSMASPV